MNLLKSIVFGGIITLPGFVLAQSTSNSPSKTPALQKKSMQQSARMSEGERVFVQNCSRCHNAPEGFSSRISGSIVRHMRVRANLSEKDAQEVLRFFNP